MCLENLSSQIQEILLHLVSTGAACSPWINQRLIFFLVVLSWRLFHAFLLCQFSIRQLHRSHMSFHRASAKTTCSLMYGVFWHVMACCVFIQPLLAHLNHYSCIVFPLILLDVNYTYRWMHHVCLVCAVAGVAEFWKMNSTCQLQNYWHP